MASNAKLNALLKKLAKAYRHRQKAVAEAENAKREENDLKEEIMTLLKGQELDRAGIHDVVQVSLKTDERVNISDPDKFYRYVKRHNAFELLERRVAQKAAQERMARLRGKPVPGTEVIPIPKLNVTVSQSFK